VPSRTDFVVTRTLPQVIFVRALKQSSERTFCILHNKPSELSKPSSLE
jgi:DNA repair protein RadC